MYDFVLCDAKYGEGLVKVSFSFPAISKTWNYLKSAIKKNSFHARGIVYFR